MKNIAASARSLVRASPADVFDAFADAEMMSRFWFTRRDDGLKVGETVFWYVGEGADAFAIEVRVKELKKPERILVEWGTDDRFTQVLWTLEETGDGHTRLSIEERGYTGSDDEVVARALDATGGFNQVIVALKALVEHGVAINVVSDHI